MRIGIAGALKPRHSSQGHAVAEGLRSAGHDVVAVSYKRARAARLADVVQTLRREAGSLDVLVVQVYTGKSFVVEDLTSRIAKAYRVPMVFHLHGGNMPRFMEQFPRWSRRVLGRAGKLIAPSTYLQREVGRAGLDVDVIPNVIDIERNPWRARNPLKPKLLWIRAFHDAYNPGLAVRTLALVRQVFAAATLTMAGEDLGLRGATERLAREHDVEDAVLFTGFLEGAAKDGAFASHDILLNTNRIDNTPVSVIEAMASGLPVVAADIGGIADLVDHEHTGLLAPDDDARAMADAVIRLLRDRALADHVTRSARATAEQFQWSRVEPLWEDVLRSCAALRE